MTIIMKEKIFTEDVLHDFYANSDYKKISPRKEISLIKRAQLSFYDEVDDKTKEIFLKNYSEEFPRFGKRYNEASEEEKVLLLDEAIENSILWREEFLLNNQALISFVIKDYLHYKRDSFTLMDMIQDGNLGLLNALCKFDLSMGTRFSTYATYWISQAVTKSLASNDKIIRVPINKYSKIRQLASAMAKIENETCQRPTSEELSEMLGESIGEIERMLEYLHNQYSLASLDEPVGEDTNSTLSDYLKDNEDDFTDDLVDQIMYEEFRNSLENSLLSDHYKGIIKLRYGLTDGVPHTLEYISNIYGVTRERIRQIEVKALKTLRLSADMRQYNNDQINTEIEKNNRHLVK